MKKYLYVLVIIFFVFLEPLSNVLNVFKVDDYNDILLVNEMSSNKKLLNIINSYDELSDLVDTDRELVLGKVINRDMFSFYDEVVIDIGSNDGVNVLDTVIYSKGLLGVVSSVTKSSSVVRLVGNKSRNISVKINDEYGVLNRGIITNLTGIDFKIGDEVYTSGLTDIVGGIFVGYVDNINRISDYIYEVDVRTPSVVDVNYVGVVK